jgi:hypothetical protein
METDTTVGDLYFINRRFPHPTDPYKVVLALDLHYQAVADAKLVPAGAMCARICWDPHDDNGFRVAGTVVGHVMPGSSETAHQTTWQRHDPEKLRLSSLFWGMHWSIFPTAMLRWEVHHWPIPADCEVVLVPDPAVNQRAVYAFDSFSQTCVVFTADSDGCSVGTTMTQSDQWAQRIRINLQYLQGAYAMICIGGVCYGIWNYLSGCIMGPPFDRRCVELMFGLPFAELLAAPRSQADMDAALNHPGAPGMVKIVRSPLNMGFLLQ